MQRKNQQKRDKLIQIEKKYRLDKKAFNVEF